MGIKFSWKKIWKYRWKIIALAGFIGAIVTIATNWDAVSDWLSSIVKPLANPIVRDVLLFVLIVGLSIWLYRRKKKARSIPPQTARSRGMEDWQYDWNLKHEFVLKKIAEKTRSYNSSYKLCEKEFPDISELEFKVIIEDLEEVGLIRLSPHIFRKKYYEATRTGREYASKGLLKEMEMQRIGSQF